MAIPGASARVSLIGRLAQGEIFNTSFWISGGVPDSEGDSNSRAADIAQRFSVTALGQLQSIISPLCSYDSVRVYSYPDGGPTATYVGEAPIPSGTGAGTGDMLPLQCALVTSLRTGNPGRRRRGRMYLPCNQVLTAQHQVNANRVNNVCDSMAAFFSSVNDVPELRVIVLSQVGAGAKSDVTSVIVDSRIDIQRRRAEDQAVTTTETTLVTS